MNKNCECEAPGFCNRHLMDKNNVLFSMCKGEGKCNDCGLKYWVAWERGQLGATQPKKPILKPEGFCESKNEGKEIPCLPCTQSKPREFYSKSNMAYIKNDRSIVTAFDANDEHYKARLEKCKGCPLLINNKCHIKDIDYHKFASRKYEACPIGKWYQHARQIRKFNGHIKRNLLMHIMPLKTNNNWKMNLDQIVSKLELFNNKRFLSICYEDKIGRNKYHTVNPDEIVDYCDKIGLSFNDIKVFQNNPKIREGVSFPWLLESIESLDPNEITFYCHGKGCTHDENSLPVKWAKAQYAICLNKIKNVETALEQFCMAGAFRRFGQFTTPGNNRWHYSGTFYWFRNDEVFRPGKDWRKLDEFFFCVESWPGRMFHPYETVSLLGDDYGDLYSKEEWIKIDELLEHYYL